MRDFRPLNYMRIPDPVSRKNGTALLGSIGGGVQGPFRPGRLASIMTPYARDRNSQLDEDVRSRGKARRRRRGAAGDF